jgi:sorting nexin-1/2
VFHERFKTYKSWRDAETTLTKKRENKAKLELANKTDKVPQAQAEITEVNIEYNVNINLPLCY